MDTRGTSGSARGPLRDHVISIRDQAIPYQRVKVLPLNEDLYQLVLAEPDDDSPRLAYADWLRTVEHPLANRAAEFIVSHIEISRRLQKTRD